MYNTKNYLMGLYISLHVQYLFNLIYHQTPISARESVLQNSHCLKHCKRWYINLSAKTVEPPYPCKKKKKKERKGRKKEAENQMLQECDRNVCLDPRDVLDGENDNNLFCKGLHPYMERTP